MQNPIPQGVADACRRLADDLKGYEFITDNLISHTDSVFAGKVLDTLADTVLTQGCTIERLLPGGTNERAGFMLAVQLEQAARELPLMSAALTALPEGKSEATREAYREIAHKLAELGERAGYLAQTVMDGE